MNEQFEWLYYDYSDEGIFIAL